MVILVKDVNKVDWEVISEAMRVEEIVTHEGIMCNQVGKLLDMMLKFSIMSSWVRMWQRHQMQ